MSETADIIVIGGGIAGASLAWQLRGTHRVVILESENSPSHHATGRSAALMTPYAGAPMIRAASLASRSFLLSPPNGFSPVPLTSSRGVLRLAAEDGRDTLVAALKEGLEIGRPLSMLGRDDLLAMGLPISERVTCGLLDTEAQDIDVDALHRSYLKGSQADLRLNAPVQKIRRSGPDWIVETPQGAITAPVVVNAAGAFADRVAQLAGLAPIGLTPCKRTIAHFDIPGHQTAQWPLLADPQFSFYVKPEATGILLSPSDATPSDPGEVWPDDMDIAIAVDRMQDWLKLTVRRPKASWSGLRSFFPDEDPVAGFDAEADGFFWYAGQGGYGIQSSPALSRVAAAILRNDTIPPDLTAAGLTGAALSPSRFSEQLRKGLS
ncbi:NAD(P)/FAD-dependent oxidoreductase [Arenibacterium halophilum]|uniref:NAD(P)/FAD-dependent oxidoreductase n=1 Tax=Arenibacterium halophilum TaxID=2583821 RepID=UPI00148704B0|nr:FAD-binding oxidoreductase [Arenibacterium halophilum]